MVMETALPDRSPQQNGHSGLEPSDDVPQAYAILQLHQPMHMIGHHNKGHGLCNRNNRGFMHCPDHASCRTKILENRSSTNADHRKQINLPSEGKPTTTKVSAMRPIRHM